MRKVGTVTCNWNGGKFLVPHLQMLRAAGADRSIVLQGTAPWPNSIAEYPEIGAVHDGSSERARAAGFEIHTARVNDFTCDLYNHGLEILSDCDVVFRLDVDMFMLPEQCKLLLDFARNTTYDCYRLDYAKCTISHCRDFDHGVRSGREMDPIAVVSRERYMGILDFYSDKTYLISWDGFDIHHYRAWKGTESTQDWIDGRTKTRAGISAPRLVSVYGENGQWLRTPDLIRTAIENEQWPVT